MEKEQKILSKISTLVGSISSPNAIGSGFCELCQNHFIIYETPIIGGPNKGEMMQYKKGCKCDDIRLAQETVDTYEKMQLRKRNEDFEKFSLIPKDIMNADFKSYIPRNESQEIVRKELMDYCMDFDLNNPINIILGGSNGVGKSHLGVATARELMRKNFSAIFVSSPRLLSKLKNTYNAESQYREMQYIEMLEKVDILIIDDIGQEKSSDWVSEKFFELLDARSGMHTFFTTNKSSDEMQKRWGDAHISRMKKNRKAFRIDGDDLRIQK